MCVSAHVCTCFCASVDVCIRALALIDASVWTRRGGRCWSVVRWCVRGARRGGGGGGGGKRRSHVPVIHFGTTRLAVERRTLRGVVVTLVCSFPGSRRTNVSAQIRASAGTRLLLLRKCQCKTRRESRRYTREEGRETARGECAAGNANAFSPQCQDGLRRRRRGGFRWRTRSFLQTGSIEFRATSDGSFEV